MSNPEFRTRDDLIRLRKRIAELETVNAALDSQLERALKTNNALTTMKRYKKALKSIAANSCCDKCQEAALVAEAALKGGGK